MLKCLFAHGWSFCRDFLQATGMLNLKAGVARVVGLFLVSSFMSSNCRTFSIFTWNYMWSEDWHGQCLNARILHFAVTQLNKKLTRNCHLCCISWIRVASLHHFTYIYWVSTDLQKMGDWEAGVCWLWLWLGAYGVPEIRIANPQGFCHGCSLCGVIEDWWDNWCGSKSSAIIPLPWQHWCQIRTLCWLHDYAKWGSQLFKYKELHCRS